MKIGKRNLKFLTIILAFIMLFLLCAAPSSISAEETEEKQLLKRFYEEGYSLQELADEQNIKLSTMKMRVKRAREKLKEKILQKQ